ncbi:MAG: nitroreductase family protein [Carboxydocellales bacterium]
MREAGGAPTILLFYMPKYSITITTEMSDFARHHLEDDRMGATQSTSALIENLVLLAHNAGLGTCWLNGPLYLQKEISQLLGIEDQEMVAAVTIGYPDQQPPEPGGRVVYPLDRIASRLLKFLV